MSIEKPAFRRREAESLQDRFNIGFAVSGFSGEGSAALRAGVPVLAGRAPVPFRHCTGRRNESAFVAWKVVRKLAICRRKGIVTQTGRPRGAGTSVCPERRDLGKGRAGSVPVASRCAAGGLKWVARSSVSHARQGVRNTEEQAPCLGTGPHARAGKEPRIR